MGFAAILWGIPLAALPVIVHLMARRRKQIVEWGAMQFLVAAKQRARRSWRLRDLLLLLLRVLGILALVFAMARPSIPISWLGGHEPRDIIVIVDESLSTAALDGTKTVYERQLDELTQLLVEKDVDQTDHLRVLMAGARPEWLTEISLATDASNRKTILEALRKRRPTLATGSLPDALELALAAPPVKSGMPRHVYMLTDGQAYGWKPDLNTRWAAVHDQWKEFPLGSEIRILSGAGEGETANLVVQKVELAREVVAAMEPVTFRATITNFSDNNSTSAILHWLIDDEEIGVVTVPAIEPGSDSTLSFDHAFSEPGVFQVSCKLDGSDVLAVDDQATAIVEVASGIPVLLVEGVPSDDPLESDSAYFVAALDGFRDDDEREVATPFAVNLIAADALESTDLEEYVAVVLTNTPPVSEESQAKLEGFVREGGGLWIALGDQMQVEWFNRRLVAKGGGLASVEIDEATGDIADPENFKLVSPPTRPHPATVVLGDTDKLDVDRARIYRRYPFAGATPRDLSVLLQLDDGSPLVTERQFGDGRVIVQSVPLGTSWSNMPLLLSYVAMVHEWLWYLAGPRMTLRNLNPGDPMELAVDKSAGGGKVVVLRPDGTEEELGEISVGETRAIHYAGAVNPGLYRAGIRKDGEFVGLAFYNVTRDPEESNLVRMEESEKDKLREAGLVFGHKETPLARDDESKPVMTKPIWEWLLISVIAFLILESLLALWVSKGRQPKTAGASMG